MNAARIPGAKGAKTSVVMCTYNGGRFLEEQLAGIAQQTRRPAELIVCDDASSDNSVAILKDFAARAPFPVRIVQNRKRLGSTGNFDQAIRRANEELIALCDQDDWWAPNKLERLSTVLIEDPSLGGVFSNATLIDEDSHPIGISLFEKHRFSDAKRQGFLSDPASILLRHNVVTGSTLMFRASILRHFVLIPQSWVHDGWLTWMIALHSRLGLIPEPLMSYRIHSGQQIGIGSSRLVSQGVPESESRRKYHARVAQQFHDLLTHLLSSDKREHKELVSAVESKIRLLYRESTLSDSMTVRLLQILRILPDYARYTRGLGALRNDLFLN
ncbi:MAG: glycosyltransferase family 2 protein [Terracidiphilus sp.]